MPHITIDCSANLEAEVTGANLVSALHEAALASKVFPTSGIRVFARRLDHCCVGNGDPANGFIQIIVRIAPGRDMTVRQRLAHDFLAAATARLYSAYEHRKFGRHVEIQDFEDAVTVRKNNRLDQD